ncbi:MULTISPECIES: hypothetical protein [Flavobacterium]|jgi:hypothetical protein|uniref:Uncharacterized protein n=1 Tax=Flavobacterium supellecticarium TaxID=2565924 RepID=A0A4S3ZVT5_9FLAO|nr:hypothetical protein [Flavobacterium supellecticarium]THF49944.1 hypothetical protein E6C50_11370 [Flavobacterium supellecticarium]
MKRKFLNILALSSILTLIGFLMDGDAKEPSMLLRFTEFFGMVGIIFLLVSTFYFGSGLVYKTIRKA